MAASQQPVDPLDGLCQSGNCLGVGDADMFFGRMGTEILAGRNGDVRVLQNAPGKRKAILTQFVALGINVKSTLRLYSNPETHAAQCGYQKIPARLELNAALLDDIGCLDIKAASAAYCAGVDGEINRFCASFSTSRT